MDYFAKMAVTKATSTINGYLEALTQFCKFNKLEGLAFPSQNEAVSTRIKRPIKETELGDLIEPQIIKIFPNNALEIKALLYFMFYTGLRRSEIVSLTRKDFAFEGHELRLYIPKQKIIRRIPFTENLEILLNKYFSTVAQETNAFNTTVSRIYEVCKTLQAYEVLGKDRDISPHLFRHSFAKNCIKKEISLPDLRDLLGHKTIEQTMQYLESDPDELNIEFRKKIKGIK
jgi:integrase/recombinase XerD